MGKDGTIVSSDVACEDILLLTVQWMISLISCPRRGNKQPDAHRVFVDSIKPYHARIMYYKELLRNAEILYRDFLDAHEDAASLTELIEEIS